MEPIARQATRSSLFRCSLRFRQPSSQLQQCRFQSGTGKPFLQNSGASLLRLDNSAESASDASSFRQAVRSSNQVYQQHTRNKEEQRARERNQQGMERLMMRKWQGGDLYTPHDLTPREVLKFAKTTKPTKDIFDVLGINPIDAYKNPVLLAEFMTSGGKIKHSSETGLRPVNQRKLAKAVRRAIGLGLMPSCYVHPEMLRRVGPDQNSRKYIWK